MMIISDATSINMVAIVIEDTRDINYSLESSIIIVAECHHNLEHHSSGIFL
jgi:hypothetical protein